MTSDADAAALRPPPTAPRPAAWLLERSDRALGLAGQFLAAATVVLVGTVTAALLYQVFDLTRLAIFFLGSVIVCALFFGTRPAVFAAFLAFVAYNFSLVEPRFSFQFAGADDALTLTAFLIVALLVGGLAGRVRESERHSRRRADLLESLLAASRAFSAAGDATALREELAAQLCLAADGEARILTCSGAAGEPDERPDDAVQALAAEAEATGQLLVRGAWRARLLSRESPLGVAVWRIGETPEADLAAQNRLCGLLIDLAASALGRIRLVDLQTEVEAGLRAAQLRDAILGSISHDLRTPLATVLASASSLRDYGDRFDADTRRNLADGMVQEADRLNAYVESLLALSRIEAGHVAPSLGPVTLIEVVDAALGRLAPEAADRCDAAALDERLEAVADPALLEQVVFNLLDNAVVHGGPAVRVQIAARRAGETIELAIEDSGVGVPDDEYDRLCAKFYRGQRRSPDARGTGIGLSIAKGFVEAMGGALRLSRSEGRPEGLRAAITLAVPPAPTSAEAAA